MGPYCDNKIKQSVLKNIDNLKIKNIEVKVDNYRRWTRNSLNIITGNFRWIPQKYKKRFNANVSVKFENDLICVLGSHYFGPYIYDEINKSFANKE